VICEIREQRPGLCDRVLGPLLFVPENSSREWLQAMLARQQFGAVELGGMRRR
jgi:hypothetical protein